MTYSKEVPTRRVCDIGCLCMGKNILTYKGLHMHFTFTFSLKMLFKACTLHKKNEIATGIF